MKESRNRDNNTKRTEYIFNDNFVKKLWMKKKRSSEILERIEGNFFKIFCCLKVNLPKIFAPPNICDPNFCPPNIYDKSTPMIKIEIKLALFEIRIYCDLYEIGTLFKRSVYN